MKELIKAMENPLAHKNEIKEIIQKENFKTMKDVLKGENSTASFGSAEFSTYIRENDCNDAVIREVLKHRELFTYFLNNTENLKLDYLYSYEDGSSFLSTVFSLGSHFLAEDWRLVSGTMEKKYHQFWVEKAGIAYFPSLNLITSSQAMELFFGNITKFSYEEIIEFLNQKEQLLDGVADIMMDPFRIKNFDSIDMLREFRNHLLYSRGWITIPEVTKGALKIMAKQRFEILKQYNETGWKKVL